jgi:hypothetical protein
MGSLGGSRSCALFFCPFLEHLFEFFTSVDALLEFVPINATFTHYRRLGFAAFLNEWWHNQRNPLVSTGEMLMESAAKIRLTTWSRFRFYAGGFFLLLYGISNNPHAFRGDISGTLGGALGGALVTFGIAYAIRGRKKVRNWNSVSQWFFWLSLILPAVAYNARIAPK